MQEDPLLRKIIDHTGQMQDAAGKFVPSADFVANEGGITRRFDLTTPGQVAKKNADRLGLPRIEYLLYNRPRDLVYPP